MADNPTQLFDGRTRRKLEQMMLIANKVRAGAIKGERRSTKRGTSIEFADYRNYTKGDDLRRMDWKLYGRTGKPFIKVFEDEEDLAVHIIVDTSRSMDFPRDTEDPDTHKFTYARRLMAGIATISLATNDRLMMTAASGDGVKRFGPHRGRGYSVPMFRFVGGLETGGAIDFNAVLTDYVKQQSRAGLAIVISDMFHPEGYLDGVRALLGRGYEVAVLHTLSPEEVEPPLAGDLRLVDVETGLPQEVTIDGGMRDIYVRRLAEWQGSIAAELRRRGVHYLPVRTDTPFEKVILSEMRGLGLVR
ncbi:MAG: DUF58 domain-containing protein [Chloroflexota bacterium]